MMADTENREDQKISESLREAFGYSDDQLLKQLDQANETFKDVNFTGAEDRLMKRFLARKAELEKETAAQAPTPVPQNESANPETTEKIIKETVPELSELEEKKKSEKKVIRFGKKKVLATAALVAVIAGMLGGTAIGKKSYFFRQSEENSEIFLDNDKNKLEGSRWETTYNTIKNQQDIPLLSLGYIPDNMMVDGYDIYKDGVEIRFIYQEKFIYFTQRKREMASSTGTKSDREIKQSIENKWLNKKIGYYVNSLNDGTQECGAVITINNYYYYIHGCIQEEEFREILKYLFLS